jgi:peroxiredoxin Q/BCP
MFGTIERTVAAPDFALRDDEGKTRRLSDRRGKFTVIYFYPKDDTPDCADEAREFGALYADFSNADTEIWGVSSQGVESKHEFRTKYGLPFVLLPDVDRVVARLYGAAMDAHDPLGLDGGLKPDVSGDPTAIAEQSRRISFLVDPDGMIVRYWPKVAAQGHAQAVRLVLETEKRRWAAAHTA